MKKRADYISWDEYFMAVAFLSAQRSKDPSSQVVNARNAILQSIKMFMYTQLVNRCLCNTACLLIDVYVHTAC